MPGSFMYYMLWLYGFWLSATRMRPLPYGTAVRKAPWALPMSYYYFRKMWQMPVCCTANKLEPFPLPLPAPHPPLSTMAKKQQQCHFRHCLGHTSSMPTLDSSYTRWGQGFSWLLCELTGLRGWGRCKLTSHLLTLGFWLHQLVSINYSISSMHFAELVRFHLRN